MIANEAREIVGGLDQPRKLSGFTETPCNPNDTRGSRRHLIRIIIAFAAVYLIWGSTFLGIRVAIHSIPPLLMAGVRWLCAGALLYSFLRWRGAPRPSGRDWMTAALIGGGIIFGGMAA